MGWEALGSGGDTAVPAGPAAVPGQPHGVSWHEVALGRGFGGTRLHCPLQQHGREHWAWGQRGQRPLHPSAWLPGHRGAAAVPGGRGRVAPGGHRPGHVPGPGAGPAQRQPGPRGPLQLPPPCHRRDLGHPLPAAGLSAPATGHRVLGHQLPPDRELLLGAEPRPPAGHQLRGHLQAWHRHRGVQPHGPAELLLRGAAGVFPHSLRAERDSPEPPGSCPRSAGLPPGEHHKAGSPRGPAGLCHPWGAAEAAAGVEPSIILAIPGLFPTPVPHPLLPGQRLRPHHGGAVRADVPHAGGPGARQPPPHPGGRKGHVGLRGTQRLERAGLGDALGGAVTARQGRCPHPRPAAVPCPTPAARSHQGCQEWAIKGLEASSLF